jgi:hypothetical protein
MEYGVYRTLNKDLYQHNLLNGAHDLMLLVQTEFDYQALTTTSKKQKRRLICINRLF